MWEYWEKPDLEKVVADYYRTPSVTMLELKARGIRRAEVICLKLKTRTENTKAVRDCNYLFVCFYSAEKHAVTATEAFRILGCLHEVSGASLLRVFSCSMEESLGAVLSVKIWIGKEVPVLRSRF